MPAPMITALPTPPQRGLAGPAFAAAADLFLDALPQFGTEANALAAALSDQIALAYKTTSATSVAIGTGTKSFTAGTGAAYIAGHSILISSRANGANLMRGIVTSYNATTGALVVSVATTGGSGTFGDWDISLTVGDGASLNSPAFTGTPTAPTAAPGTNTTQLANTSFVQAAVAALVASSPAALDTLNELATALGNDANFATTMTNALAGKQGSSSLLTALAALTLPGNALKGVRVNSGETGFELAFAGQWTLIGTVATTSGTSAGFTAIPDTYEDLMMIVTQVSGSASSDLRLELGSSTAYTGTQTLIAAQAAANAAYGTLFLPNYKRDVGACLVGLTSSAAMTSPPAIASPASADTNILWNIVGGVDRIRLSQVSGNFDLGSISLYGR